MPFSSLVPVEFPGIPRYAEHLVPQNGFKVLEIIGETRDHSSAFVAWQYAEKYNRFLLRQIPGSDEPEPGYGIPKPDEIVSKGGELTTANIAEGRDLKRYDDGGNCFQAQWRPAQGRPRCSLRHVRNFIWRHWRDKHQGYIRVTFEGIDAFATNHIFIEPNAFGHWQIIWRFAGVLASPQPHIDQVRTAPTIIEVLKISNRIRQKARIT